MQKYIAGENGIGYFLGKDGLYYPDLHLPEETEYPIGKYGGMMNNSRHCAEEVVLTDIVYE